MDLIKFLFKRSRGMFITAIIVGGLAGASGTYLIALVHRSLREYPFFPQAIIWSFVVAALVRFVAGVASRVIIVRLGQAAIYDLRVLIPNQILAVPLRRLEQLGMNRLLAILTGDVHTIAQALVMVPNLIVGLLTITAAFIYLGTLSWQLLCFMIGILVVGLFLYRVPARMAMMSIRTAREHADSLMQHFQGTIDGVKELKIHSERQGAFMDKVLKPTADQYRRWHEHGMSLLGVAGNWGQTLVFIFVGLALYLFADQLAIEKFTLMGYILTVLFVATYIEGVLGVLPMMGRAKVALKKVEKLTQWLTDDADPAEKAFREATVDRDQPNTFQSIELDHVAYAYTSLPEDARPKRKRMASSGDGVKRMNPLKAIFGGGGKKMKKRPEKPPVHGEKGFNIGPLNLRFEPGELVFLIGGNGSGKTTLIKLLSGLYQFDAGRLKLNGEAVGAEEIDSYRRLFSVIYQDFYLFDSLLGLEENPDLDDDARRFLHELHLENKVDVHNGRFTSTELSQGQRKRLALLTAILEDRPFYIFDEWAADQDPTFKGIFYNKILPELKARNKAVLVISHDDQYHHVADRLIKLDYGQVEYDKPTEKALVG